MMFPSLLNDAWISAVVNHLWQSTAVALIAWLLTWMLRSNQARTRYWVWMIASVKFLLPFSLLIAAGESLRSVIAPPVRSAALAVVMEQLAQPFPQAVASSSAHPIATAPVAAGYIRDLLPFMLVMVWLIGFFGRRILMGSQVVADSLHGPFLFADDDAGPDPGLRYGASAGTRRLRDTSSGTSSTGEPRRSPLSAATQCRDCA